MFSSENPKFQNLDNQLERSSKEQFRVYARAGRLGEGASSIQAHENKQCMLSMETGRLAMEIDRYIRKADCAEEEKQRKHGRPEGEKLNRDRSGNGEGRGKRNGDTQTEFNLVESRCWLYSRSLRMAGYPRWLVGGIGSKPRTPFGRVPTGQI